LKDTSPLAIAIAGMHCAACVRRVTLALQSVPALTISQVTIGAATVQAPPAPTTEAAIRAAIERMGFTITSIRPDTQ
jgi:copper chaperone